MYPKAALFSFVLAAFGTSAAPNPISKRADSIPLTIYEGPSCTGTILTTANVPTDGSCFGFSPILSGNTDSFRLDVLNSLPEGCVSKSPIS